MDFVVTTTSALDPVLMPEGFAAGQGGETQVIYCAGHDELSDRFPRLPQANAQLRALRLDEAATSVDGIAYEPLTTALATLAEVLPPLFRTSEG